MRDDVRQRAEGLCECRLSTMCDRYGNQAHHILPRSKGGGDHVDNLAWVCQPCHTWIHNHPTASRVKGLLK